MWACESSTALMLDGGNEKVGIALRGFLSAALEQAAIEQVVVTIDVEVMHRPGDSAGRAVERDFHLCIAWHRAGAC